MGKRLYNFETFKKFGMYEEHTLKHDSPSAVNREVRFKKFRIIVEEVDEPVEIYQQRLQYLWDTCDNHHNVEAIRNGAKSIGYELKNSYGTKRNK